MELLSKCVGCMHHGGNMSQQWRTIVRLKALAITPAIQSETNAEGMTLLSKGNWRWYTAWPEGLADEEIPERLDLSQHTVDYSFECLTDWVCPAGGFLS